MGNGARGSIRRVLAIEKCLLWCGCERKEGGNKVSSRFIGRKRVRFCVEGIGRRSIDRWHLLERKRPDGRCHERVSEMEGGELRLQ